MCRSSAVILVLMLVLLWTPLAKAQQCIDYQEYIHWEDSAGFELWGEYVLVSGDLAFCMVWDLAIMDISDPEHPVELSYVDLAGSPKMAVLDGDLLYLACSNAYDAGFTIFDVSDPTNPSLVSTTSTSATAVGVDDLPGIGKVACISYRSLSTNYLRIYNVDNPANPVQQAFIPLPGGSSGIRSLAFHGELLYICQFYPGAGVDDLLIYDIGDPTSPTLVGGVNVADNSGIHDIEVVGDHLFAASRVSTAGQLLSYSLADPEAPLLSDAIDTFGAPFWLGVTGTLACLQGNFTLSVVDIGDPDNLSIVGGLDSGFEMLGVDADGGQAVAVGEGFEMSGIGVSPWLLVADLSSGQGVTPLAEFPLGITNAMVIEDDLGYMLVSGSGLEIYDLGSPLSPQLLGTLPLSLGYYVDIRVVGDRAILVDTGADLTVVDVSDPAAPHILGTHDLPGTARYVATNGTLAWVATSEWDDMWWDYVYRYACVDITDPTAPVNLYLSSTATSRIAGLEILGDHLCIAGGSSQDLRVMDITDPSAPLQVGGVSMSGGPRAIGLSGDTVFLAGNRNTMVPQNIIGVVDLSDPTDPQLQSVFNTNSGVKNLLYDGTILYVASYGNGLEVFDLFNMQHPIHLGCYNPAGNGYDAGFCGDYICLSTSEGLHILPRQCALTGVPVPGATAVRLSNNPNPFNPDTRITFSLERAGDIRLTVHDIGGRLLRVLVEGPLAAGEQQITWDGRDARGNLLPSGVYLARLLENGIPTGSGKLTLLK